MVSDALCVSPLCKNYNGLTNKNSDKAKNGGESYCHWGECGDADIIFLQEEIYFVNFIWNDNCCVRNRNRNANCNKEH